MMVLAVRRISAPAASRRPIAAMRPVTSTSRQAASNLGPMEPAGNARASQYPIIPCPAVACGLGMGQGHTQTRSPRLAGQASGAAAHAVAQRAQRAQQSWRQVPAVLLKPSPGVPASSGWWAYFPEARARWTAPDGKVVIGERMDLWEAEWLVTGPRWNRRA